MRQPRLCSQGPRTGRDAAADAAAVPAEQKTQHPLDIHAPDGQDEHGARDLPCLELDLLNAPAPVLKKPLFDQVLERHLPVELMYQIIGHLPREAHAALALTSKQWLKRCGGYAVFHLSKAACRRFLPVLDKDLAYHSYCSGCSKLHTLNNMLRQYPTAQTVRCWRAPWESPRALPPLLTNKMLRLAMQWYREGRQFDWLLGKIEQQTSNLCWHHKYEGKSTIAGRVVGGELMFRVFDFVLPPQPQGTWRSFAAMRHLRKALSRSACPYICPHRTWEREYPFLHPDNIYANLMLESQYAPALPITDTQMDTHMDHFISPELFCMLEHHQPCDKECSTAMAGCRTELVKSCHLCHTDFTLSAVDVETVGRVIVMTSWKNVGRGLSPTDPKWTAHFADMGRRRISFKRADKADVCMEYEGMEDDGLEQFRRPLLTRQDLSAWLPPVQDT